MKIFAYLFAALVALAVAGGAQAQTTDTYVLHGTVERTDHPNNKAYIRGDDGRDYVVDIAQAHVTKDAKTAGQEVTVYGRRTGDRRIEAFHVVSDRDYQTMSRADRDRLRPSGWEQLHGQVVSVEGSQQHQLKMRTDDGQNVMVDMSRLPDRREEVIRNLRPGAAITVIGDGDSRSDRFVARSIRFDDRDLNRRVLGGAQATSTAAGNRTLRGTVVDVQGTQQHLMRLRTDDGKTVMVDMSSLPDRREDMVRRLRAGASVTVIGDDSRSDRFIAREVRFNDRDVSGQPAATGGEVQVRGTIDTIHQDNMRLRTDDGRIIRVNIDPVRDNVRERVKVGQRVTVMGVYTDKDANKNEMTARTVRVDGAQSSAPATPSGEQQVRGTIDTIHNDNLRLRADDGRMIKVNIDPVPDNARERIKVGQRVTVFGVYTDRDANRNEMKARTVRVDDSAAASPATSRPRNADDCKDKGWSSYRNPSFKNQGDCVSHVNSRK